MKLNSKFVWERFPTVIKIDRIPSLIRRRPYESRDRIETASIADFVPIDLAQRPSYL